MMASIPNMRSTPLPVPAARAASAGDPASGGFAVPATSDQAQAPETVGGPCLVAPPVLAPTPVELVDGIAPQIADAEGTDAGDPGENDGTAPAKAETKDNQETQPAIVIPFIQPQVSATPQVRPIAAGMDTPQAEAAGPAQVRRPGTTVKNDAPVPDVPDAPETDDTDVLQSAVKALLQRKPLPTKQVAAGSKPEIADAAKAEPAPVKAPARQVAAPAAPAIAQAAGPLPAAEPQPALSPNTSQSTPAVTDKAATVDGVSTSDLVAERKLDLARDGQWLDRLARDIARSAADDSPLRFRLHPQTLGSLHVELQQGDRGTAVRMTVDTEAARQILTDAQPRLAAEARAQGVRIAETHVDLSGSGRHAPGDQRRQDEARQTPLIRTATGAGAEADAAARASRRARLDRYA